MKHSIFTMRIFTCSMLLLLCAATVCARHNHTRNKGNNAHRNNYQRLMTMEVATFELRGGRLYACGDNNGGSLGIGNLIDQHTLVPVGTDSDWVSIWGGSGDGLPKALKSNGTLWGWGLNNFGQIGIGTTTDEYSPVQIGTDQDWVNVSTGVYHVLALKSNGTLWVWGQNSSGQLGLGNTTDQHSPVQMGSDNDWVAAAVGTNCSWAIKADGTLWSWGNNVEGQLGQGDMLERHNPTQVGSDNKWVSVVNGGSFTHALKSDGTIWGWGQNQNGVLGNGNTLNQYSPVQIGNDHDWVKVVNGPQSIALKADGSMWGWGSNNMGQLGLGYTGGAHYVPELLNNIKDWTDIAAGGQGHTVVLKTDGSIWVCGKNNFGQLGLGFANIWQGVDTLTPISTPAREEWITGATGGSHSIALKSNGSIWCWGNNDNGQLGLGSTTQHDSLMRTGTDSNWVAVSAGSSYSMALKTNGRLWAWGRNDNGQLGNGNNTEQHSPVQVGGSNWVAMSTGDVHSMALKADGTLWAWGNNSYGQLGLGNFTNQNSPTQVGAGDTWLAVAAGEGHTLALKVDGTLWAWGNNIYGQLGTGNFTNLNAPVQIGAAHNWTSICAGANHSLAMKADGTLWVWGRNSDGQLGLGNNTNMNSPVQVGGDEWLYITGGSNYTLAYKTDGSLWSWGNNDNGQLGIGNNTGQNLPVAAPQQGLVHAFGGPENKHSAIIKDTRRLLCLAGNNNRGQLGDSTTLDKNTFNCINDCVIPGVTITVAPNDTICTGDTVVFTATPSNGGPTPVYQWFRNNTPVGNNNTLYTANGNLNNGDVIKCVMTGSAACSVYPTDTSNLITITTVNTVTPTISIAADMGDTICQEHIVTYTATITNGGLSPVYQWYEDNIPAGSNTPSHTPNQVSGTVVKCQLTSSAVCATPQSVMSTAHTMLITPVTTPQVTVTADPGTLITQNQSVTFTATVTNAVNPQYQWKKNAVNLAGETQSTYTTNTLQNGDIISCRVRGLSMCDTGYGSPQVITVIPVGVGEMAVGQQQFAVWPNPVKNILYLDYANMTGLMELTDVTGRVLIQQELQHSVDMKGLASGMYMLRVVSPATGAKMTFKVVKE